ncbi:MAG: hypothetical protein Q7S40_00120 [Opitutaceae bacterium]|nr:hypothetical protein [Opitutaceae bacterium]
MKDSWKAGAAATVITPAEPMWLAGWAARREPASGTGIELFAKALAFEDEAGVRAVIVTADLIAIPHLLAEAVAARVRKRWDLPRERLLFNASHTHTGPEIRPDKVQFFEIPTEYAARIGPYVAFLEERMAGVIEAALTRLEPVTLRVHEARAAFAVNRRTSGGPVDHDVPIVAARRPDGSLLAMLFGYACHNLTLPPTYCQFHGDYAGVAQQRLQEQYAGAMALFLAGAGADQDPSPRGTIELVRTHGATLAGVIATALGSDGISLASSLAVAFEEITLELRPMPAREALETDAHSEDIPRRRKANYLLGALADGRTFATSQRCPVQVLRLGRELLLIALGGEPVVDFALQFKKEFAGSKVWVAGYANDMFGYLPTRRVQQEGGYEAERAVLWSALPMPLAESAEAQVVDAVGRLVRQVSS